MNELSPKAKQAVQDAMAELGRIGNRRPIKEILESLYDTATTKLREELESETDRRVLYEAYIRDAAVAIFGNKYGSTGGEAARSPQGAKEFLADVQNKLAHQQPSPPTSDVEPARTK